ncbi:MAG: hypothetical protein IPJ85_11745 [Flavobacteriales bacterium]|nr:hypothetical protein [Flavobacteriales bacterium]
MGLLITLSPELAASFGMADWSLPRAFILFQIGICVGDLGTGVLSQLLRTRRWIISGGMLLAAATAWYSLSLRFGNRQLRGVF